MPCGRSSRHRLYLRVDRRFLERRRWEPKPQYGSWGYDSAGADKATRPGDDFFRYANGAWIDKTDIPADKPGYSLRLAMSDLAEQRLHDLTGGRRGKELSMSLNTLDGKIGAFLQILHGRGAHRGARRQGDCAAARCGAACQNTR